jgi:hypothetical protein
VRSTVEPPSPVAQADALVIMSGGGLGAPVASSTERGLHGRRLTPDRYVKPKGEPLMSEIDAAMKRFLQMVEPVGTDNS